MKKLKKVGILLMVSLFALIGVGGSASAQTGSTGSCGVKVWNDEPVYASWATTIDYKISKSTSECGTVYYKATVMQRGDGSISTGYGSAGYFSYSTPVKYFYIDTLKKQVPWPEYGYYFYIHVNLYSDAAHTNYIGYARSANFELR